MTLAKVDIRSEFSKGWALFKENMGLLVMTNLLAMVLTGVTCGLLSGPMTVGLFLIVERLIKHDPVKPLASDVFKGFDFFLQSLLLVVIALAAGVLLGFIPVVGQIGGLLISAFSMWGMMLVAYRQLSAIDALKTIFAHLNTGEFTIPLVLGVLACLMASLGVIACIVGIFFTLPLSYCIMACCYQTLFAGAEANPLIQNSDTPPPPPDDLRQS